MSGVTSNGLHCVVCLRFLLSVWSHYSFTWLLWTKIYRNILIWFVCDWIQQTQPALRKEKKPYPQRELLREAAQSAVSGRSPSMTTLDRAGQLLEKWEHVVSTHTHTEGQKPTENSKLHKNVSIFRARQYKSFARADHLVSETFNTGILNPKRGRTWCGSQETHSIYSLSS